jgi:hypothetical protein
MSLLPGRRPASEGLAGLLARVGRGDRVAFAALHRRTAAEVLGLVNLMLGDTAAAEDVTATVYQQLCELPRVSWTGNLRLFHTASCPFRNSSMTSCGVRYPSPEWRRV